MIHLPNKIILKAIRSVIFLIFTLASCSSSPDQTSNPTIQAIVATKITEEHPTDIEVGHKDLDRCTQSHIKEDKLMAVDDGDIRINACQENTITHIIQYWPSGIPIDKARTEISHVLPSNTTITKTLAGSEDNKSEEYKDESNNHTLIVDYHLSAGKVISSEVTLSR